MPSFPSAQGAAGGGNEPTAEVGVVPSATALDDVAAAAARLTARQRREEEASCALDAIPHLARPLAQLRRDTHSAAAAHPAPPAGAVHASAVRLLASAPDFQPDRLRRAVDEFCEIIRNPARAAALADSAALSWLDDPASIPLEDLSAEALQARHRDAIIAHAQDHLRLDASIASRKAFRDAMEADLAAAKIPLLAALNGAVDPSSAIPTPFTSLDRTPDPCRRPASGSGSSARPGAASGVRAFTATPTERRNLVSLGTPASLPSGRPPRSGGRASSSLAKSYATTPSSLTGASFPKTPGTAGSSFAVSASPTPSRPGTPNPRNVVTADPDADYLSVVRDHVLGADIPAEIAGQLLEHARQRGDHPHFLACLGILTDLSRLSASRASHELSAGVASKQSSVSITFHDIVCSARCSLEAFFAQCIGGVPLDVEHRTAAAVRAGVRAHVSSLMQSHSIRFTHDMRNNPSGPLYYDDLPFWPQFYFCLRCGSPSAALALAEDAHEYLDEEGIHFRFYLHEFLRQGERHRAARGGKAGCSRTGTSSSSHAGDSTDGDENSNCELDVTDEYMSWDVPGTIVDFSHYVSLAEEYEHYVYQSNDPYRRASYVLLSRLEVAAASGSVNGNTSKSSIGATSVTGRTSLRHRDTHKMAQGATVSSEAARCSLRLRDEDYGILFDSMEDYYWLRLWLCRTEQETDLLSELGTGLSTLELTQVQDEVQGFGHSYFDYDGKSPLLYAYILVAAGLPWQAVEYLASQKSPIMSAYAAYIALPMSAMGWAPSEEAYGAVVWAHAIHFACDHPTEAALCLFTLRNRDILGRSLQQLVVDTQKYVELLGDGREERGALADIAQDILEASTGDRSNVRLADDAVMADGDDKGAVEDITIVEYVESLKQEIASALADTLSRPPFSVSSPRSAVTASLLFSICGNKEKERDMILQGLASVVSVKDKTAMREDVISAARRVLREDESEMPEIVRRSFGVLLEICEFFDDYWAGLAVSAWSRLECMDALPLDMDAVQDRQQRFGRSSNFYSPVVSTRVPDVLRAALELAESCLGAGDGASSGASMSDGHSDGSGPKRGQIHALVTFAGLMGLSETELNGRLVRLELLLS